MITVMAGSLEFRDVTQAFVGWLLAGRYPLGLQYARKDESYHLTW